MSFRRQPVATDRRLGRLPKAENYGTPERWQHSGRMLELTERAGILAARALEESLLDVLMLRGWISIVQRDSALRLKLDYHLAKMEARLTGSYNPVRNEYNPLGPWDERTDAQEAAYQRWRHAIRAIGKIYSDLVITVVCHDKMPSENKAPHLKAGLEKLVKWYGLPEEKSDKEIDKTATGQ